MYEAEKNEVVDWLKHPNELGKAPSKIEYVKEFTDEDGIHCLIFRFKSGFFSPWLLAIHSDSGIFSEQEPYDEANDVAQATKILEFLKQYWKSRAKNLEEEKAGEEKATSCDAFVLKKQRKFEPDLFLKMFEQEWGEKMLGEDKKMSFVEEGGEARVYKTSQGFRLILDYMEMPIPNQEAEENAKYNYMWPDAVSVTATHTAHEFVMVIGGENVRERAMFFSKVLATLCKMDMENNIGVYMNGTVYEPKMIVDMCNSLKKGELPIPLLVWCHLWQDEGRLSAWTDGMENFGFDEMEVLQAIAIEPSKLLGFMTRLIEHCINQNIGFHDGETVAFGAGMQLKIEKSQGCNVNQDGETLKITFE